MKHLTYVLTAIASAAVALLLVPVGTAGAAPAPAVTTANFAVSATGDSQSVLVKLRDGVFQQVDGALLVVNSAGKTLERVPLSVSGNGKTVPLRSSVAADKKSAELVPLVAQNRHQVSKARDQAWNNMMAQLNKDWPCASGFVGGGALIGFLLGLLTIVGWPIGLGIGAAAGAYIGYTTCNNGAGWRAAMKWWNTP